MSRDFIGYNEVSAIADKLMALAENPTIEKIRLGLGSKGSNSTISKYLNQWRSLKKNSASVGLTPVSPPDPVNAAVHQVWEKLHEEAQSQMTTLKAQVAQEAAIIQDEKEQLALERERYLQELESFRHHLSEAKTENINLKDELNSCKTKIVVLNTNLTEAEKRHAELMQGKEKHINELNNQYTLENQHLRTQIEGMSQSYKKELDELRTLMEKQRHEWLNEKDALKIQHNKVEKELHKQEMTAKSYQEKLSESIRTVKASGLQLEELNLETQQLREEIVKLDKANSAWEAQCLILKSQLEEQKAEQDKALKKLEKERESFIRLEERLQQALKTSTEKDKRIK